MYLYVRNHGRGFFLPLFGVIFSLYYEVEMLTLKDPRKVYVKCTLRGEPARIILELKERGIVKSVREAVVQGLLTFYEKTMERDLKRAQARTSLRLEREAYHER